MGNLVFQATLGGQVNLVGPNTASTYNINVPAVAGTLVTTGDTGSVSSTMLASSLSLTTPNIGVASGTSLAVTAGLYSSGSYSGTYTDGIVADYTTGLGRISVGSSDGIAFYNGGVANTERMRLDSSGNLGLGVTPSGWGSGWKALQVTTGNALYTNNGDRAALANNAYYNGSAWTYATTGYASRYEQANGVHTWYNAPSSSGSITFTQAMMLDASGRLGIGSVSTPASYQGILGYFQNGRSGWAYVVDDSANTHLVHNIIYNGTNNTYAGTGPASRMSIIDADGSFRWYQAGSGSAGGVASLAERARIDSSGNLLVGTTNSATNAGDGLKFRADLTGRNLAIVAPTSSAGQDTFDMYSSSAAQFQFYVDWSGVVHARSTSISGLSDQREKENVRVLETGLTEVMALQPRRFDWINGSKQNVAGFIAQEVQQVLPDLIDAYKHDDDERFGLRMGDMIPTLVKAIQELKAIVDAQAIEIAALKG